MSSSEDTMPLYSPPSRSRRHSSSGGGDGGSGISNSGAATGGSGASYPLAAHLRFCPGGITCSGGPAAPEWISLYEASVQQQATVIAQAKQADDCLRQYSLLHAATNAAASASNNGDDKASQQILQETPHFLPSLAVLAEAVFGRLTGCPAETVKAWADAMVLSQYDPSHHDRPEVVPTTEDDILQTKPSPNPSPTKTSSNESTVSSAASAPTSAGEASTSISALLKRLLEESEQRMQQTAPRPRRPCGYVFKRGDIAWNCRTCQADPTCVICDDCFRASNHEGHEVYFHRTSPGGCCDCGDVEAWNVEGCCDKHQPDEPTRIRTSTPMLALDDPWEAVRTAATAKQWAQETLTSDPVTSTLPVRLRAALGVVMGAAVHCLLDATDGAGVGADCVQWSRRWADEAARIVNAAPHPHCYYYYHHHHHPVDGNVHSSTTTTTTATMHSTPAATVQTFLTKNKNFPENYRLQLRLHNDDVHTFDEVIDALHEPRHLRQHRMNNNSNNSNSNILSNTGNNDEQHPSLVSLRDHATEMTHHVDADGQVTVKTYSNIASALRGFRRLKSRGLHCSVVSTAQVDLELRARALCTWLTDLAAAHPVAQALLVHALLQLPTVDGTMDDAHLAGVYTWHAARTIPPWVALVDGEDEVTSCRRRFAVFPPHLPSSYLTHEEAELLHGMALSLSTTPSSPNLEARFLELTGTVPDFYSMVPYRLPSQRYHKSPHALWGTLPAQYSDPLPGHAKHPLLELIFTGQVSRQTTNRLSESIFVVDTDLRKQQEGERITISVFPHKLPGLNLISGIGMIRAHEISPRRPPLPSSMDLRHLLATSSFRAPLSPILLLLLLDPYPTKQLRGTLHALFLSLLTNARFKSRFAAALALAYRPLSTLFCAGVGTEADTPLHFTVQIFTAGSIVRALGYGPAAEKLFLSDGAHSNEPEGGNSEGTATAIAASASSPATTASIGVFILPIAHIIARCIHTNLLGAIKEVNMILNNTSTGDDDNSQDESTQYANIALLPALTYVAGEHPLMTQLPAAPDDGFLDSRSTRHKRLPHLLRDLDYVIETPGTALRLLLPMTFPVYQGPSLSFRGEDVLTFPSVFARMLRLAQGMDPQKRKISGGHVEYEQNRWLEAFGLSLNFGGTRDALAESPCGIGAPGVDPVVHVTAVREAMGNLIGSLLREVKLWLYREGMLETGLPVPPGGSHAGTDLAQAEALQRSTLHVSSSQLGGDNSSVNASDGMQAASSSVALSCATGVKMTEAQLTLIENALRVEAAQRLEQSSMVHGVAEKHLPSTGPVIGDWLRVPHSPLGGDSLSFHLPLHRALAKCIRSICSVVIPEGFVTANPNDWWKIPVLDVAQHSSSADITGLVNNPLVPLIRPILRSSNCRVVWASGPDCSPQEAQRRRARSRTVSANIAVAKIIHSLADHPIRCLAAAQQIEGHLWTRNGTSVAGMAMNYSSSPLCRSFRDLDLLLVQLSAAGMSCGLGARRVFSLLVSRFSMDGYLCDPERRAQVSAGQTGSSFGSPASTWVNPPRLQDPDHAVILAESFFSTLCVLVTELPAPPPTSSTDDTSLRRSIRRELLHALAADPRSHSEAMSAASCGISRREETEGTSGTGGTGGLFRSAFSSVLREIGRQKNQNSSRAASGPPAFELKAEFCDEYDPTFFHLRRKEHQHAMEVVARLRKQKWGDKEVLETHCLPLVCVPPKAHPRFLPSRLLLHLDSMDAALRRSLLFALTNGSWLPPSEPSPNDDETILRSNSEIAGITTSIALTLGSADIPMTTFHRRGFQSQSSSMSSSQRRPNGGDRTPFSGDVVAASSVSFLEVLQLLTLQVHTLEECASLHRTLPDLDDEARSLSSGLSVNSYLGRLVRVPESLVDVWALRPHPDGPLISKGSGENRGSILGLLITLYEHRGEHQNLLNTEGVETDDGHGGARSLASSGLKWLLRFVSALVDGAHSVGAAVKSATTGTPVRAPPFAVPKSCDHGSGDWTIDDQVKSTIRGMLQDLPDLWPKPRVQSPSPDKISDKSKEARKAHQKRVMEMMRKKQADFAATIAPTDAPADAENAEKASESDLCIICRCDDADGENNGPLGYLGHVQRSRMLQLRTVREWSAEEAENPKLVNMYRVVGHMGCQLRESDAMDSKALSCLPKGSIVSILKSKVSNDYDILSRRVLVRHTRKDAQTQAETVTEGWASVQSSQGYVILSPLVSMCYSNTRWGSTRPIIKQCGHAAHLTCVETHTLSLHQRAAGEVNYDGRYAANIKEGEFLCPLCKQLSNILIPRDGPANSPRLTAAEIGDQHSGGTRATEVHIAERLRRKLVSPRSSINYLNPMCRRALEEFGANLHTAMRVSWERTTGAKKSQQDKWHSAIFKWDYEDSESGVKHLLRLLRQQLIAWAAVGHSAAALEAGTRGVESVMPFGVFPETTDPWQDYGEDSMDTHPMLLELKRVLSGVSGLLEILFIEMAKQLAIRTRKADESPLVASCLADILEGKSWLIYVSTGKYDGRVPIWSESTALVAAMPSHVAKDGTIPLRCEARATAAAMWVVKGLACDENTKTEPPAPLAVTQLFTGGRKHPAVPSNWGSLNPFADERYSNDLGLPSRLGVACGYLYTPLMAWDMCTFTGAVLSCALASETADLPTGDEILRLSHSLLLARIVQAIITPQGFEIPDEMDLNDENCWTNIEVPVQGLALAKLVAHCRAVAQKDTLGMPAGLLGNCSELSPPAVLAGIGRAILPFARSLVLMLRACCAVIRERHAKNAAGVKVSDADKHLQTVLCQGDLMTTEDGFFIAKCLRCPLPSDFIDESTNDWFALINRWLVAIVGFEKHHGSYGNSVVQAASTSDAAKLGAATPAQGTSSVAAPAAAHQPSRLNDHGFSDESGEDEMAMDIDEPSRLGMIRRADNDDFLFRGDIADSDEELADSMDGMDDDAEEMVAFDLVGADSPVMGAPGGMSNGDTGESDDNSSSAMDEGGEDDIHDSDRRFANSSRSPILPYQPSFLGRAGVGVGRHGSLFEYSLANEVMSDLSHLGLGHQKGISTFTLIRLPKSFVELYNIVNRVKGREDSNLAMDDSDDIGSSETSICLLTGAVMRSGSTRRAYNRTARLPGACTLHARKTASGIGIFFLVQKCTVLLMHNNKSAYSASLYVDEHGEEDPQLRRGRPLLLNEARYRALEMLWRQQRIPREVAQIRSTSERVIRDNWY